MTKTYCINNGEFPEFAGQQSVLKSWTKNGFARFAPRREGKHASGIGQSLRDFPQLEVLLFSSQDWFSGPSVIIAVVQWTFCHHRGGSVGLL